MANTDHAGPWQRLTLPVSAHPGLTGAMGAVVVLLATVLVLMVGGLMPPGLSGPGVAAARWIPGLADGLPYRPPGPVQSRALSDWPWVAPDRVQITHAFERGTVAPKALSLLAPSVMGEASLFVNGVPTEASASSPTPYLALTGGRPMMWEIPPHFLRPGLNRLDLVVTGARHRSLMAPLMLGPPDRVASLYGVMAEPGEAIRPLLPPLAVMAAALALAAGALLRIGTPWVGLAAAAAAAGARTLASDPVLPPWLEPYALTLDPLALAAAVICLGCAFSGPRPDLSRRDRAGLGAGAALLVLLLGLALFGAHQGRAELQPAGLGMPVLGLIFLAWTSTPALRSQGAGPVAVRGLAGAALGTLALTAVAAVATATGLAWGLWVLGLEAAYGLGVLALLGGLAIVAAVLATRAIWRWALDRPRLSRLVLTQKREIEAAALALRHQERRSVVLEERQRLSRDMHDGIGGQLSSLLARVRSRGITPDQLEGELASGLAELRLMVDSLDASDGPVADALAVLRSRLRTQTEAAGMRLEWFQSEDLNGVVADPGWILNLNRLIQEAVTNAIRHSGGTCLDVEIRLAEGGRLTVLVRDDGAGFDRDQVRPGRGLSNLSHRAAQLGGEIRLGRGEAGQGTVVEAMVIAPRSPAGQSPQPDGGMMPS